MHQILWLLYIATICYKKSTSLPKLYFGNELVKQRMTLKSCATIEKELFERTRLHKCKRYSFASVNKHTTLAYYRLK